MQLVAGQTLRDWLSDQPGGRSDKLSGRSVHPAVTISDALARVDVSLAIVSALLKLKRLAFFADFKPRNIMIKETKVDRERKFSACMVDIGGVVLHQDVSTATIRRRVDDFDHLSLDYLHPIKDRYLIETTCSYLSPEMALLIAEYDFWKGRLSNHFFKTRKETRHGEGSTKALEALASAPWLPGRRNGTKADSKSLDLRVTTSYLEVRRNFEQLGILQPLTDVMKVGDEYVVTSKLVPSQDDVVTMTERSSVFTMGLVMVELFGGKRTGLTSLTRLPAVADIFLNEMSNAEFRIVMEWEVANAYLEASISRAGGSQGSTCASAFASSQPTSNAHTGLNSVFSSNPSHRNSNLSSAAHFTDSETFSTIPSDSMVKPHGSSSSSSLTSEGRKKCPSAMVSGSFFDLYRRNAYPTTGLLSACPPLEEGHSSSTFSRESPVCCLGVQALLDSCLRFKPCERPTLSELHFELQNVRQKLSDMRANRACSQTGELGQEANANLPPKLIVPIEPHKPIQLFRSRNRRA